MRYPWPVFSLQSKCPRSKTLKARQLRKNATQAEVRLWNETLSCKRLGVRARRQKIIRGFIVDFYIPAWGLVIEIDGPYHETEEQMAKDARRSSVIENLGFRIIRFTNAEVMNDWRAVREKIVAAARPFKLPRVPYTPTTSAKGQRP